MEIKTKIIEEKEIKVFLSSLNKLNEILKNFNFSKTVIVTHQKLWQLYGKKFPKNILSSNPIFLPEGEQVKSFSHLLSLYKKFSQLKLDRKSVVIIFGGGVLGDMVGFAGATFMRGINIVQIPTTLLAMIDSSIGGKTAINLPFGKNMVGSFYQPKIIFCDLELTRTLPEEEFHNALGEILKYAILNKKIFGILDSSEKEISYPIKVSKKLNTLVLECIKTKLDIVKKDEKETLGLREKLNLGHTIAHTIETLGEYKSISHGKAVILGLIAESYISYLVGVLSKNTFLKIIHLIDKYTQNIDFDQYKKLLNKEKILELLKYDKKVQYGKVRFVLPEKIGSVAIKNNVPESIIKQSLSFLDSWI